MLALGDGFYRAGSKLQAGYSGIAITADTLPGVDETKRAVRRHDGRGNVAFCDRHVESPRLRSRFKPATDEEKRRWNRDHEPHADRLPPANLPWCSGAAWPQDHRQ